jgi:hypothetical protein
MSTSAGESSFTPSFTIFSLVLFFCLDLISCTSGVVSKANIIFHAPTPKQTVSGRTFLIDVEVSGLQIPEDAKGILYLDNGKLLEVRQQHVTVNMDGAGGLTEGQHSLRLVLFNSEGSTLLSESVSFMKEGSPEELAGPFHDSRYDDETLIEVLAHDDAGFEKHTCRHQPPVHPSGRKQEVH